MNPAAHLADVHDPPTCPGCGRSMRPVRHAVYTCDHNDTPPDLGLPRGDNNRQLQAEPGGALEQPHRTRRSSAPWPGWAPPRERQPGDSTGAMTGKKRRRP